jgi:hypothetical protein
MNLINPSILAEAQQAGPTFIKRRLINVMVPLLWDADAANFTFADNFGDTHERPCAERRILIPEYYVTRQPFDLYTEYGWTLV